MAGIVATDWLADHLQDGDLRLIDARGNFAEYEMHHLPGAQFLHIETLRMTEGGVPCKMLSMPMFGAIFGRLGIGNDTPVVVYTAGPADQLSACYTAWSLAVSGNPGARILDGGLRKWEREGRAQTVFFPRVSAAEYAATFVPDLFADWRYVIDHLEDPEVVLVDSRTRSAYAGQTAQTPRPGHIPGAVLHNYLWDFTAQGVYAPLDLLRARYERAGITPDKEIIAYCVTGREGSSVWFALTRLLGYPRVRLYQASLMEWSERAELPMVVGQTPWGEASARFDTAA